MFRGYAAYTGAFVLSFLFAIFLFILAYNLAVLEHPNGERSIRVLQELFARTTLLLAALAVTGLGLIDAGARHRIFSNRWQTLVVVLFWMGLIFALGDPFHGLTSEQNWIRYWTAGVLACAGVIGLWNASRRAEIPIARFIGLGLGVLLLLAGFDEVFQFHEKFGSSARGLIGQNSLLNQQDLPTLGVALVGIVVLVALLLLHRSPPRFIAGFKQSRFTLPITLFGVAAVAFAVAMVLDTFDVHLMVWANAIGLPNGYNAVVSDAAFWHYLIDIKVITNSLEEVLEYLSAIFLLMTTGSLFLVTRLGFGDQGTLGNRGH
ncbi:MAG: hypothetical protein ACTSU0_09245 [Alphaproteobacteria bacterium]